MDHPFEPVCGPESRILILGSFPSVRSREDGFYYGHPRNRFWPLMAAVFGEAVPVTRDEKTGLILRHSLALWDVIASCDAEGSLDSGIRNARPVPVRVVLDASPISRVVCNGRLAGKLYGRHLESVTGIPAAVLPSTSPANAAWPLERLLPVWRDALTR